MTRKEQPICRIESVTFRGEPFDARKHTPALIQALLAPRLTTPAEPRKSA